MLNIQWKVAVLSGVLGACALSAMAAAPGWIWLDERGQKVFSDMPPPANVPKQKILRQPETTLPSSTPVDAAPSAPAASASSAKPADAPAAAGGATALSDEQRKAQVQDEAKRQATERRNAEIRAENCSRAKTSLATLDGGGRLATVNEQGQRVIMDTAMRNAERAKLDRIIADNCR